MALLIALVLIVAALVFAYWQGEDHKVSPGGIALIAICVLVATAIYSIKIMDAFMGTPQLMTQAPGAYITLSRVNDGESSYCVVKDAKGEIMLLEGKTIMPDFKSFVVKKDGEVSEFK